MALTAIARDFPSHTQEIAVVDLGHSDKSSCALNP